MIHNNYNDVLLDDDIIHKFKEIYPDIDINMIDSNLLEDMVFNVIDNANNTDKIKNTLFNDINNIGKNNINNLNVTNNFKLNTHNPLIIKQNYELANEFIPEMLFSTDLIKFNGKINGSNVKIMLDTGASSCVIFKSVIEKNDLLYLIDTNSSTIVQGAHSMKSTVGTIWYLEIELEIKDGLYISVPIIADVIDDSDNIEANKIIKNYSKNNSKSDNNLVESDNNFGIILGMTFLKSYKVNIDFSSMIVTLNGNIKIKFK